MKVHILFDFKDGAWGGANQFLKALRKEFVAMGVYECDPMAAEVIIINSHHFLSDTVLRTICKLKRYGKHLVHRIDGPVSVVRGIDDGTDNLIAAFNKLYCDATVFQSVWSRAECYKKKIDRKKYEACIINSPDPTIFHRNSSIKTIKQKVRLIATSWSSNMQKGFDVYRYIDENLDFNKYEFTFVGNCQNTFKNIKHVHPVDSILLGEVLREHDIYIAASRCDPCSNALLEALHCGLPSVALCSGGHPEIIGKGGETFSEPSVAIEAINKVAADFEKYRDLISVQSIEMVARQYIQLCQTVRDESPVEQWTFMKCEANKAYLKLLNNYSKAIRHLQIFR